MFAELDPAGRAGSDEREFASVLESFNELVRLFHDSEVSSEVHVVNAVETEAFESCDHLALDVGAGFKAEALADLSANGRSTADSDVFRRIGDGSVNPRGVVLFVKSADRASDDTLTAVDAGGIGERKFKLAADRGIVASVLCADGADRLDLVTDGNASAAKNTLTVVADDGRRRFVDIGFLLVGVEVVLVHAELIGKTLEFAGR